MEVLFSAAEWVGKASLQATFLALTLWWLKRLHKSEAFFALHYLLGIFIIARLCLPMTPSWQAHPLNWFPSSPPVPTSSQSAQSSRLSPEFLPLPVPTAATASAQPSSRGTALSAVQSNEFSWQQWLAIIWAIGLCLTSLQVVRAHVRHRSLMRACVPLSHRSLQTTITKLSRKLGIQPPRLVRSPMVGSAAVTGCLHPTLIVGDHFLHALSDQQRYHVLTHELIHIKRCDPLINGLTLILQALHWFNPLVRWALKKFHADRELVCDALAIRHLGERQRHAYGETLIALLSAFRRQPTFPHLVPIVSNKSEIKRRIMMIATNQPNRRPIVLIAGLAVILALAFTRPAHVVAQQSVKEKAKNSTRQTHDALGVLATDADVEIEVEVDLDLVASDSLAISADHPLILSDVESRVHGEGVIVAPGKGKQIYDIHEIDTTAFGSGGILIIDVTVGDGGSAASFDLFPAGTPLPHGFPSGSVAKAYDVPPGQSRTLVHQFSQGQVFRLGTSGNWFSKKGQTNEYEFEARAIPLSRSGNNTLTTADGVDVYRPSQVVTHVGRLSKATDMPSLDLNRDVTVDTIVEFVPNSDVLITKDPKTGKTSRKRVILRSRQGNATITTDDSVDQLILVAPDTDRSGNKRGINFDFDAKTRADSNESKASN